MVCYDFCFYHGERGDFFVVEQVCANLIIWWLHWNHVLLSKSWVLCTGVALLYHVFHFMWPHVPDIDMRLAMQSCSLRLAPITVSPLWSWVDVIT